MRVLIVDDEAPMRTLLRSWVEREGGASVIEAGTAEEGLELVASESPAVVLSDIRLPGEDGLWLAAQIRIHHPQTAVVMTTGVLDFGAAVNSLQSGVVDYLVKPFSRERLSEALNRAWYANKSRLALEELQRELDERRTQITEALGDLELNVGASLEAMLAILRARDPESYEHARRVASVAVNLVWRFALANRSCPTSNAPRCCTTWDGWLSPMPCWPVRGRRCRATSGLVCTRIHYTARRC